MTQSAFTVPSDAPPPGLTSPGRGGGPTPLGAALAAAAAGAKPDPTVTAMAKRMRQISDLAAEIQDLEATAEKTETAVAAATAERSKAMAAHNAVLKEIEDAKNDLVKLGTGGHVERFEFSQKEKRDTGKAAKAAAGAAAASGPADDEAARAVRLDSLKPAMKPAKLKALAENNPPIETIGDWLDWEKKKGSPWCWKDVKGFGEKGLEQLQAATDAHWAAHPRPTAAGPTAATTPKTFAEAAAFAEGRELTAADVNLAGGDLDALCHEHIRNALHTGAVPDLRGVVTAFGLPYVCVLPPPGAGDDRYQLLPLYDASTAPKDLAPQNANDITGREATHQGKRYLVGPSGQSLIVRDAGAGPASTGPAKSGPATVAKRAKSSGAKKAVTKKAAKRRAGGR